MIFTFLQYLYFPNLKVIFTHGAIYTFTRTHPVFTT